MNAKEIQDLIKFVAKVGVSEVEIEQKDFKITIKTNHEVQQPIVMASPPPTTIGTPIIAPPAIPAVAPAISSALDVHNEIANIQQNDKYLTVKSPMIGTFYRSPGPDKDAFVSVGQHVSNGDTLCIIEAMKLFNEIESEVSGKILKVLVDDASPVEYDQPLFLIDPS